MRVYLPAVASELADQRPPRRGAFVAVAAPELDKEGMEVLEDDAQTDAALVSLELIREDEAEAKARVVIALDVPGPAPTIPGIHEISDVDATWDDVAAILVDGPEAADAVEDVTRAENQDSADEAVADLWDYALEWYAISERLILAARLTR